MLLLYASCQIMGNQKRVRVHLFMNRIGYSFKFNIYHIFNIFSAELLFIHLFCKHHKLKFRSLGSWFCLGTSSVKAAILIEYKMVYQYLCSKRTVIFRVCKLVIFLSNSFSHAISEYFWKQLFFNRPLVRSFLI